MAPQVLSVGQCGADHSWISSMLKRQFGCSVTSAGSLPETLAVAENGTVQLILVNRLLDRDGSAGLEVIKALKQNPQTSSIPVMLVSNYEDAQQAAVAEGALPGFGKSEMQTDETQAKLSAVLT